jgi:hypothetical protein
VTIAAGSSPQLGPDGDPAVAQSDLPSAGAPLVQLVATGDFATATQTADVATATASADVGTATAPAATAPAATGPRPLVPVPGVSGPGLTGAGVVTVAVLLGALALVPDLLIGEWAVGPCFTTGYLAVCVGAPLVARVRALFTVAVLPPLMYAGAVVVAARTSGQVHGSRELVLETGTRLALGAPVLFVGAALAALLVLVRLVLHLIDRRR